VTAPVWLELLTTPADSVDTNDADSSVLGELLSELAEFSGEEPVSVGEEFGVDSTTDKVADDSTEVSLSLRDDCSAELEAVTGVWWPWLQVVSVGLAEFH